MSIYNLAVLFYYICLINVHRKTHTSQEVDSIEDFEVEDMSPDLDQEDMALDLDEGHRDLGYGRSFSRSGRPSCYRRSPRRQYECCECFFSVFL